MPVRLTGEVTLLNSEVIPLEPGKCGAPELQRFTFQCPGLYSLQCKGQRDRMDDGTRMERICRP